MKMIFKKIEDHENEDDLKKIKIKKTLKKIKIKTTSKKLRWPQKQ